MESEPGRLLLLYQSAAAGRRGNNPFDRAGTASHRICAAAGNDRVIYPKKHSTMYRRTEHSGDPANNYLRYMDSLNIRVFVHTYKRNQLFFCVLIPSVGLTVEQFAKDNEQNSARYDQSIQ